MAKFRLGLLTLVMFSFNFSTAAAQSQYSKPDAASTMVIAQRSIERDRLRLLKGSVTPNPTLEAGISQRKIRNINTYFRNIKDRYEAAVRRLNLLSSRIDSRLTKLAGEGEDIAVEQALLDSANNHISESQAILESAQVNLQSLLLSTNPREEFLNLKVLLSDAKEELKLAHADLVKIITMIEGLRVGSQNKLSPTVSP